MKQTVEEAARKYADDKCQERGVPKKYRLHFDFDIDMTLNKGSKPVLNGLQIGLNQSCRTIHRQTEKL